MTAGTAIAGVVIAGAVFGGGYYLYRRGQKAKDLTGPSRLPGRGTSPQGGTPTQNVTAGKIDKAAKKAASNARAVKEFIGLAQTVYNDSRGGSTGPGVPPGDVKYDKANPEPWY